MLKPICSYEFVERSSSHRLLLTPYGDFDIFCDGNQVSFDLGDESAAGEIAERLRQIGFAPVRVGRGIEDRTRYMVWAKAPQEYEVLFHQEGIEAWNRYWPVFVCPECGHGELQYQMQICVTRTYVVDASTGNLLLAEEIPMDNPQTEYIDPVFVCSGCGKHFTPDEYGYKWRVDWYGSAAPKMYPSTRAMMAAEFEENSE